MTINIDLGFPRLVRQREPIFVPDEVYLLFSSKIYTLRTLAVSVKGGEEAVKFITHGEPIDISSLCRTAGSLDIEISLIANGQEVKSWRVEPLILREASHGFEAIPEIQLMRAEIERLKTALGELISLEKLNENI